MAAPTITNGEEHFFPVVYSGNGQGQTVGNFVPFTDNGTIAKSCMFDDGDGAYLSKTYGSAGTSQKKFTFSCWVKRGFVGNDFLTFFNVGAFSGSYFLIGFNSGTYANAIQFYDWTGSTYRLRRITNRTFEDTSKWYHIVVAIDTTQATASDRVKFYVDGDEITSFQTSVDPSLNLDTLVGSADTYYVGSDTSNHFDGYLAEVNYVDGQALGPDTFGVTDTSTGRWVPKALTGITYGTNGFRLEFGSSSNLGDDTSGNTNDFSVSNLVAGDQRNDTPTNNLPTMRPYNPSYNTTQAQGNLQYTPTGTNAGYPMCATLRPNSGKWYAEVRTSSNGGGNVITFGIYIQEDMHYWDNTYNYYPGGQVSNGDGNGVGMQIRNDGQRWLTSSQLSGTVQNNLSGTALAAGDVIGIAVDVDNSLVTWYANDGSSLGSASILRPGRIIFTAMAVTSSDTFNWNFGDNGTFDGNETAGGNADEDGNGNFYHSVPAGFKMLRQDNMPETDKGVTGFTWLKDRDNSTNHYLVDSSRNYKNALYSNGSDAEVFLTAGLRNPLKGGFEVLDGDPVNGSGRSFVSWNWVANAGTTESISVAGDIDIASTVQKNTAAGFSIVQWTGNNASTAGIGHGLSAAPEWILIKNLNDVTDWFVYHKDVTADQTLKLNSNSAPGNFTTGKFDHSEINATKFEVASGGSNANSVNGSGDSMIAYCWHGVDGFSKFGSYTGNGNADGPFIYTGFKPAWVMVKRTNTTGSWAITDTTRDPFNPTDKGLVPDSTSAEGTGYTLDHLSNGFKLRLTGTAYNASGGSYIYIAFAEHPFVGDGTNPVTAR